MPRRSVVRGYNLPFRLCGKVFSYAVCYAVAMRQGISVMISIIPVMKVRRGAQGASVTRGRHETGGLGPWPRHKKTPLGANLAG